MILARSRVLLGAILALALSDSGALADRIVLVPPARYIEQASARVRAAVPDLSESEVLERVAPGLLHLDRVRAALVPVQMFEGREGKYYYGRILRITPAADPDAPWGSDERYPKILFQAYGRNGTPLSQRETLISYRWFTGRRHDEYDTMLDLRRLLSNRDELLGVPIGSPTHRASIYQFVDPQGDLGLYDGRAPAITGQVVEGGVTLDILQGYPTKEEWRRFWLNDPYNPRTLVRSSSAHPTIKDAALKVVEQLVKGATRSRKYPGFEEGLTEQIWGAIGLLGSFSVVRPGLAPRPMLTRAKRLRAIGEAAQQSLLSNLRSHPSMWQRAQHLNADNEALPVTFMELAETAALSVAHAPTMPFLGDADPLDVTSRPFGSGVTDSGQIVQVLVAIAGGRVEWPSGVSSAELRSAAGAALLRLIADDPREDPAVRESRAFDRGNYRRLLYGYLFRDSYDYRSDIRRYFRQEYLFADFNGQNQFVENLLRQVGWGPREQVKRLVDSLIEDIFHKLGGSERKQHLEWLLSNGDSRMKALVAMAQPVNHPEAETARNAQFAKQYALDKVDEISRKHQEERREFERETRGERPWVGPSKSEAFLKLWESAQR